MRPARHLYGLLLASSTSILVSAQQDSLGCTTRSFGIPSWLVQDVTRTDGVLTFDLVNRATNYTASLACEGAGAAEVKAGLYNCTVVQTSSSSAGEELDAAVEFTADSTKGATYHIKQSWRCDDRGQVLTFTALGTSTAPSPSYSSPLLIRASLTSPVSITPVYNDGPLGHDSPGCTSRSTTSPAWVLSAIHFADEPGDGVNFIPLQNFMVVVVNTATGYEASCNLGRRGLDENGMATLGCNGYEFQSSSVGAYPVSTRAWFDAERYQMGVEQTWFCDDEDAAKPLQITASGNTTLSLTCRSVTSEITGLVNRYCSSTASTVSVPGTLVQDPVTLAPYALEDPVLTASDHCTLTSILHPRWTFSHLALVGEKQEEVYFEVILEVDNRGFQYPIAVNQGEEVQGAEGWYECVIGDDGDNGLPLFPYWCQFKYERETKTLEMKAKWACNDLDRENLVHFSGSSTGTLDSEFSCDTLADGLVWCTTEDPGYRFTVPITDVTW
ncbi:hypothetical protein VTJ49DRAFT_1644 [Mycothermus thermophilus]|uniref:Ig-like domain-containing protein n=1 Tax=Humicola insolens TaxID=85995 RepID=A0ABR3VC53_HUMIN